MTRHIPFAELVVTGFGPFGDHNYNPSTDAARALADVHDTKPHLLPVTYTTAAQFARAHLQSSHGPLLFIHLGLGSRRSQVCFECRARNERDATPDQIERRHDSDGLPSAQPVVDEPHRRRSTEIDVASLVASYNRRRPGDLPPARVSDDCGAYVCNAIYYHSLRACEGATNHFADALFVHIPTLSPPRARRLGRMLASVLTPSPAPAR